MKRVVLFDPSYGTANLGDHIINESIMRQMSYVFTDSFLVRYSTHNPVLGIFQQLRPNGVRQNCESADYKFIGGTNILKDNLLKIIPGWNIDIFSAQLYSGSVCIGAGRAVTRSAPPGRYTKKVYERALSRDYYHSVRDESSKDFMQSLGFEAINTGCPTTWGLTPEVVGQIPQEKSPEVIFTITDYAKNHAADNHLLSILFESYEKVSCWIQGSEDLNYLRELELGPKVSIIPPSLGAFADELDREGVEYVGTRLHAGIFALQRKRRSVIIAVDNRALDMSETNNLPVIERAELNTLPELLYSKRQTTLTIDFDAIAAWKSQFAPDV